MFCFTAVNVSLSLWQWFVPGCGLPFLNFPRLAFSFDLLDWVEALLLECQVAVKEFCGALFFKCPYIIQKVFTMCLEREGHTIVMHMLTPQWLMQLKNIGKPFSTQLLMSHLVWTIFRFIKQELRNPSFLCENLDRGNVCPACPVQVCMNT